VDSEYLELVAQVEELSNELQERYASMHSACVLINALMLEVEDAQVFSELQDIVNLLDW
jgi:hypothetical protein